MSVRLRFKRMGNTHRPFYRLTAVDQRDKRDGRVIEELGTFDPLLKDEAKQANFKLDRVAYWISVGAQPSETVGNLITKAGLKSQPGTKLDDQPAELLVPKPKPKPVKAEPVKAKAEPQPVKVEPEQAAAAPEAAATEPQASESA